MLTLEQILAFFKTEEGKKVHSQVIQDYIQNDEGGKELLESVMAPELVKAKTEAVREWETTGQGKALKEHNTRLLAEIKEAKEKGANGQKLQNLLDIAEFSDYNELEKAVLSITKDGTNNDEERLALKKQASELKIRNRELETEVKNIATERDSLNTAVQDSDSYISNLLISEEIKSALLKQGFDENQAQGLVHRVNQLGKFKVEKDPITGERRALNEVGLTPETYTIKEYLVSSEGKAFKPNMASGGGSKGDGSIGGSKAKNFGELSWTDRNAWKIKDPIAYDKARQAHLANEQV